MTDKTKHIPMQRWGKDHWSTFGYIETRVVSHDGVPDKQHMRCDASLHPAHAHRGTDGGSAYPTRLNDGEVSNHDDWSCLDDAEAEGLLTSHGTGMFPRYALTEKGVRVAHALREHKRLGGNFKDFHYPPTP